MKTTMRHLLAVFVLASVLVAGPAKANLNLGVQEYEAGNFARAARLFYDVTYGDPNPINQQSGLYYLGRSLLAMDLYIPALFYLAQVADQGAANKHFLQAVEALVEIDTRLEDDYIIPQYLDGSYTADFASINPKVLHKVNYIVGKYNYRRREYQRAFDFLDAVGEESLVYPKAQYLMGVIFFANKQYDEALTRLSKARDFSTPDAIEKYLATEKRESVQEAERAELTRLHRLSNMGLARTLYGQGKYPDSTEKYLNIQRFTEAWIESTFENAWSEFQQEHWGKSLGNVHTLLAPHFRDYYLPEAWLLRSTAYYQICKFDLAEVSTNRFFDIYEPILRGLEAYMTRFPDKPSPQQVPQLYNAVSAEPNAPECRPGSQEATCQQPIPRLVHMHLKRNERFQRLDALVKRAQLEKGRSEAETTFAGSRLQGDLLGVIAQQEGLLVQIAGAWVQSRLRYETETLQGFFNRAQLIKFEIVKAQKDKLMSAGDKKTDLEQVNYDVFVPRPTVPDDSQYYYFDGEFWLDELGYYELSVLNECKSNEG
jgi:tetratricopeptide (TPR) repeat protein